MFSNIKRLHVLVLVLGCWASFCCAQPANHANNIVLKAKPQQCVVLNEGQACHKTIRIYWQANKPGDYCLVLSKNKTQLQCWQAAAQGVYQLAFDSSTSLPIYLIESKQQAPLASVNITVSWVYEARRESRASWRLF